MSPESVPDTPPQKRKAGRPPVPPGKRQLMKTMLSETVACRVTKSDNIAIQFTANYFGLSEADWIRTVLLANVIQKDKPIPTLPTPITEGVQP